MISSKQDTQDLDVEIDGRTISFQLYFTLFTALTLTIINTTDELKLLDVTIDEKLTFSEHISATCKKASSRVGVLMRLRKLIPVESKLRIYKAAILPYLTYCGVTWHFCKKSDSSKLDRINERGLRAVYSGDWSSPYSELLARAKMTTLTGGDNSKKDCFGRKAKFFRKSGDFAGNRETQEIFWERRKYSGTLQEKTETWNTI